MDEISSAEGRLGCENQARRGKHRTEVTEGSGWWTKFLLRRERLGCEDQAQQGKHRTEATEGIGVGGRNFLLRRGGLGARNQAQRGKHRTEVTEVTEGDWVGGRLGQLSLR